MKAHKFEVVVVSYSDDVVDDLMSAADIEQAVYEAIKGRYLLDVTDCGHGEMLLPWEFKLPEDPGLIGD